MKFPFGMANFQPAMLIFRSVLDGVFKYFVIFTPKMGEEAPHFDEHIFQMAWFNHQPEFDVILES